MKRIILLITSLLTILLLNARDDYRYRNITMNDGLTANAVRNIVQDKYGFIWFGTDNGLCRYDGRKVQPYRIAGLGINQYVSALMAGDEGLYVGTQKGVFLLRFDGQAFERLPMDIHSTVTYLSKDKEGSLWVSTMEQGVWCLMADSKIRHYDFKEVDGFISQVYIDRDNQIWTVTNRREPVVQRLNRLHDRFEPQKLRFDGSYNALRMLQTSDGRLWFGTWENGLLLMHDDGRLEQVLSPAVAKTGSHIHTLFERSNDCIYIGCDDGVVCFNPKTREIHRGMMDMQGSEGNSIANRFVYSITSDTEGGLWMGSYYGGVTYISPISRRFVAFAKDGTPDGLNGNVISQFCEDRQGRIWVGSDDGGLMCYAPKEQRFLDYPHQDILSRMNVHALCLDDSGDLWIGTYTDGVLVMNLETGQLRRYRQTDSQRSLDNSSSYSICIDSSGRLWVATMAGLNLYDRRQDEFSRIGKINATTIDIDEDGQGRLWLSTQGAGVWRYDCKSGEFRQYVHDDKDETSIPDDQVNCALVDQNGTLWIGSLGGLCRYDAENDCFRRVRLEIRNQNVMSIIEDHGALWLATERGVVKYVPGEAIQQFTRQDGLVGEQAQPNASIKASDGLIYIGTTNGFSTFYPYRISVNKTMSPVYITSMEILNRPEYASDGQPLDLSKTKEISLGYSDARMLTFSFASLSYCSPEKNQYAYCLEGFDREWNYVDNQNRATYTNIPPGSYTFRVKATNNDGIWSDHEATLKIVVHPPFWWSWYAKLFYLLLIGVAIWYYVRFRLRRVELRHQREMQRLNEEKEKEVREARLNFFTMIAHEIRTPVSLIIGPLEKMMKGSQPTADLRVIDRNAHRLLELVNQLLDFRKVEQQSLVMHFAPQNIHELVQSVSERFAPTFEQGGKRFLVNAPDEHFTAMIDKEAVTKVISNLLTNANKYTKDEVRLTCNVEPDGEHFRIEVADNGVGIREEDRRRIFEPFFQAQDNKPGTGIGLNIVKTIVAQHHGDISVASEVGKGSVFTVVLPVVQEEMEKDGLRKEDPEPFLPAEDTKSGHMSSDTISIPLSSSDASRPTMLIVDDSEDMLDFLANNFQEKYEVLRAGDGIEALNLLQKHEVSIIISDWMMPRMDGAEFCRQVRRNPLTSHIPFVMLTAKTDDDSKVQGMDVGADTYIEKPFSVQYLEACIRNMLLMRRRLMEKFATQPAFSVEEIAQNPTDNEFLIRMNKIIEENFSNPDLNVAFLADKLNISRSGLFAKIKTLADVTPNEMIQIVRLKKAAQLLREGNRQISEVCYMVGFSTPSYFSKCFQKQFGIKPGAYGSSGGDGGS